MAGAVDNFDRFVGDFGTSISDLKTMIASMMGGDTKTIMQEDSQRKEKDSKKIDKMGSDMAELLAEFKKEFKGAKEFFARAKSGASGGGSAGSGGDTTVNVPKESVKNSEKLKENLSDSAQEAKKLEEIFKRREFRDSVNFFHNKVDKIADTLSHFSQKGMGGSLMNAFKEGASNSRDYQKAMKGVLWEINGITGAQRVMQKNEMNINKLAYNTGFEKKVVAEQYMKAIRKGMPVEKKSQQVIKSALTTATLINASAESTSDLFTDWSTKLQMNEVQLQQVGRSMLSIARHTGLSGENLVQAVKASETFGNLTSRSADNLMEMSANAHKMGADLNEIMTGITSPTALFHTIDPKVRAMLQQAGGRAGTLGKLQAGDLPQDKDAMKATVAELRKMLKETTGAGSLEEFKRMSPQERTKGNLTSSARFGKEFGAIDLQIKALEESAKSYADRMADIEKERAKALTKEEKQVAEQKKAKLFQDEQFKILTAMSEAAHDSKDMPQAFEAFTRARQDMSGSFKAMGLGDMSNQDAVRKVLTDAMKTANAKGGKFNIKQIEQAMGNREAMAQLVADLGKVNEEKMVGDKKATDPGTATENSLLNIKNAIEDSVGDKLNTLVNLLGPKGYMALAIAGMGIQVFKGLSDLGFEGFEWIRNFNKVKGGMGDVGGNIAGKLSGVGGKVAQGGEKVGGALSSHVGGWKSFMGAAQEGGAGAAGKVAMGGLSKEIGVVSKAFSKGAGGSLVMGMKALGVSSLKVIPYIGEIAMAMEVLEQTFDASSKAAEIFGVTEDKVTLVQKAAAENANLLTGTLNMLTFGIFGKYFGPTGTVSVALAKFLDMLGPLTVAANMALIPFGMLWGVIKGLARLVGNVFVGVWEALKAVIEPFKDLFAYVGEVLADVMSPFKDLFSGGNWGTAGDWMRALSDILAKLGEGLGWIVKMAGEAVGIIFKLVFTVLKPFIYTIGKLAKIITGFLAPALTGLWNIFGGIMDVIGGIFTFDLKKIGDGILGILDGIFLTGAKMIWGAIKAVFEYVKTAFWELPEVLIGMVWEGLKAVGQAIMFVFMDLPKMIWDGIRDWFVGMAGDELWGDLFKPFIEAIDEISKMFEGIWNPLMEAFEPFKALFDDIIKTLGWFDGSGMGIWDTIKAELQWIVKKFLKPAIKIFAHLIREGLKPLKWFFAALAEGIRYFVSIATPIISALYDWFAGLWKIIKGIINMDDGMIGEGIMQALSGLGNFLWGIITTPFKWVSDVIINAATSFKKSITDLVDWILSKIPGAGLLKKAGAVGDAVSGAASSVGGAIKSAANWMTFGLLHDGATEVPATGPWTLEKGEAVIPKDVNDELKKAQANQKKSTPADYKAEGAFESGLGKNAAGAGTKGMLDTATMAQYGKTAGELQDTMMQFAKSKQIAGLAKDAQRLDETIGGLIGKIATFAGAGMTQASTAINSFANSTSGVLTQFADYFTGGAATKVQSVFGNALESITSAVKNSNDYKVVSYALGNMTENMIKSGPITESTNAILEMNKSFTQSDVFQKVASSFDSISNSVKDSSKFETMADTLQVLKDTADKQTVWRSIGAAGSGGAGGLGGTGGNSVLGQMIAAITGGSGGAGGLGGAGGNSQLAKMLYGTGGAGGNGIGGLGGLGGSGAGGAGGNGALAQVIAAAAALTGGTGIGGAGGNGLGTGIGGAGGMSLTTAPGEIQTQLQAERAKSAPVVTKMQSKELTELANQAAHLARLPDIADTLKAILAVFENKGPNLSGKSTAPELSTADQRQFARSADTHEWVLGKYSQTAGRVSVNSYTT